MNSGWPSVRRWTSSPSSGRDRAVGKPPGQVLVDGGHGQELDPQLLALPVSGQLLLHRAQRMRPDDDVDGAERAEQQEARRLAAARERGDEVERGIVAPVQILQHEYEGISAVSASSASAISRSMRSLVDPRISR